LTGGKRQAFPGSRRKRRAGGAVLLFLCAAILCAGGMLVYFGLSGGSLSPARPVQDELNLADPDRVVQCLMDDYGGIRSLEAEVRTAGYKTFFVSAKAVLGPLAELERMDCAVYARGSGEKLLSETTSEAEAEWRLKTEEDKLRIVVTAATKEGEEETKETELDLSSSDPFIWPIEPQYKPLIHDYYLVKNGPSEIAGLTHNNGKTRIRHYVQITGREHYGFDITAETDTDVLASAAGRVILAAASSSDGTDSSDYGNYMILQHDETYQGKTVYTLYAHLNSFSAKLGSRVEQGDLIAKSGNTGGSRIPHCHVEFRIGANNHNANIDPLEILPKRDLESLPDILPVSDGFLSSSYALYASIRDSGWEFTVKVKAAREIKTGGQTIPEGTEMTLAGRNKSSVRVVYQGKTLTCRINDLLYTY